MLISKDLEPEELEKTDQEKNGEKASTRFDDNLQVIKALRDSQFKSEFCEDKDQDDFENDGYEELESEEENASLENALKQNSFFKTNRYHLIFKENDIEKEKKRLSKYIYGPSILLARNKKQYYKILSFRKHKIFNMKTINEIESKYVPADDYFKTIRMYKKIFENRNQKVVRFFVRFFFFEE